MEFSVLSNNLKMPMMGFGVFQVTDKDAVSYTHLDVYKRQPVGFTTGSSSEKGNRFALRLMGN